MANIHATHEGSDVIDRLEREAESASRKVEDEAPYETAARAGYAAKGAVYCLIGVLALMAAFGPGGQTAGSSEALSVVKQGTFGTVLLAVLALGLVGYVFWRFTQAIVDPENVSDEDWGWLKRGMYAVSGIAYGLLAYSAIQMVLGNGGGGGAGSSGGGSQTQSMTAELLSQPFGPWLVGAVGLAIAIRGLLQARKAYREGFFEDIRDVGHLSRDAVRKIGKVGLTARGAVFVMIAGFLIWAAITHDPSRARGLEGSLNTLAGMSGGPWLLAAAGAGLLAYGVFQFIKARYRVIG